MRWHRFWTLLALITIAFVSLDGHRIAGAQFFISPPSPNPCTSIGQPNCQPLWSPPFPTPTPTPTMQAVRANDYLNYIGVNDRLCSTTVTPTDVSTLAVATYLPTTHITQVRVGQGFCGGNLTYVGYAQNYLIANAGVTRTDCTTFGGSNGTWNPTTYSNITGTWDPSFTGGCTYIELQNEATKATPNPNPANPNYPLLFAQQAQSFQQNLGGRPIWGVSYVDDHNPASIWQYLQTLSPLMSTYLSDWNTHPYPGGGDNTGSRATQPEYAGNGNVITGCGVSPFRTCNGTQNALAFQLDESATLAPNLPGVATEGIGSYGSYYTICGSSKPENADLNTQMVYVERGLMTGYNAGLKAAYIYDVIDYPASSGYPRCTGNSSYDTYGLINVITNGTGGNGYGTVVSANPKPVLTSLGYMNSIIFDSGGTAGSFTPTPLGITLSAPPDVQHMLMEQSSGVYLLALWSVSPLWNTSSPGELSLTSDSATITCASGTSFTQFTQVVPSSGNISTGAWSKGPTTKPGTFYITGISQYPRIVEIIPSTSVATPEPLPTNIPTPGPTETP